MLYINPDVCIDCNACVEECPVDAIYSDDDIPEKLSHWREINARMSIKFPVIGESQPERVFTRRD